MATTKKKKKLTKKQQKQIKKSIKKYPIVLGIIIGLIVILCVIYFTKTLDPVIEKVNPDYTCSALFGKKPAEPDTPVTPDEPSTPVTPDEPTTPVKPENPGTPIVDTGELKIYSIEMHDQYGDALFIQYGDFDMLIDSGNYDDGKYVQKFVDEHISSDKNLDVFIATHCHGDHLGGVTTNVKADRALNNVETISYIIDYGHDRDYSMQTAYEIIRQSYINKGTKYYPAYEAVHGLNGLTSVFEFGELKLEIIDTNFYATSTTTLKSGTSFNEYSVATLLTYKNVKLFCAGDLEDQGEYNLVKNAKNTSLNDIKESDNVIYKMCHHGTDVGKANNDRTGSQVDGGNRFALLEIIKPDYVFVSSAIAESAHPYVRALATCLYFTDNLYFNGTNGNLCLSTDGASITITGEGATTNYKINGTDTPDYEKEKNLKYTETAWYQKQAFTGNYNWYTGGITNPTIKDLTEAYLATLKSKFN